VTVFYGRVGGFSDAASTTLNGPTGGRDFGSAVEGLSDINGDGHADVAVTSSIGNRADVFVGGATGPQTMPFFSLVGGSAPFEQAPALRRANDINADGFADFVAVGTSTRMGARAMFVFTGATTRAGIVSSPGLEARPELESFGTIVRGVGDTNGDGFADVASGARAARSWAGAWAVYYGSDRFSNLWTVFEGASADDNFGSALARVSVPRRAPRLPRVLARR
jgi:hypothetical protein